MSFLPETEQEVFDIVAAHLLKQGARSMDSDYISCAYRGTEGRKCAAGVLIPDSRYAQELENKNWFSVSEMLGDTRHKSLINDLQVIHDSSSESNWAFCLKFLALERGFDQSVLKEANK